MPIRLLVETLGGVERALRDDHARIGVGSQLHMTMTGFRRVDIEAVRLIPVPRPTTRWPVRPTPPRGSE